MSSNRTIDIGLVCVGSEIIIPIEVTNSGDKNVDNLVISVTFPATLKYDRAIPPEGTTFDDVNHEWTIPTITVGQELKGYLYFIVLDDRNPTYTINFAVNSHEICPNGECASTYCIIVDGLGCSEFHKCDPDLAYGISFLVGKNSVDNALDVSTNDNACPESLVRSYQWFNTDRVKGTITGTPDSFTYTPETGFCGVEFATYSMYCGPVLVDKGEVQFDVSCSTAVDDTHYAAVDSTASGDVSANDTHCLFGGGTRWILVSEPTADGSGLSEPTSEADVTITDWDQSTGQYSLATSNGFTGTARFSYYIECFNSDTITVFTSPATTVNVVVGTLPAPMPGP